MNQRADRRRTTGADNSVQALMKVDVMDLAAELTPSAPLLAVQHAARTLRIGGWARLTDRGCEHGRHRRRDRDGRRRRGRFRRACRGAALLAMTGQRLASLGLPVERRCDLPAAACRGATRRRAGWRCWPTRPRRPTGGRHPGPRRADRPGRCRGRGRAVQARRAAAGGDPAAGECPATRRGDRAARRGHGLSPAVGRDAPPGQRGAGAAGRRRGRAHRLVPAGRWRAGAVRHPGRASRRARAHRSPAAFGMLHRRFPGLAALRLRRPAARRHPPDGARGWRRPALPGPGGPRHRARPTSCAPTCCRTAGSTRSTPTIISASAATSATSGRPPRCCASSGSSGSACSPTIPAKIAQLERYGIEVAGRVPHIFARQRAQSPLPADQGRAQRPHAGRRRAAAARPGMAPHG